MPVRVRRMNPFDLHELGLGDVMTICTGSSATPCKVVDMFIWANHYRLDWRGQFSFGL